MHIHEPLDVVIVGAGLSGVDAAYRLQTLCPNRTYAIYEARDAVGGTWDLFRYPGVRSDSDMHTLGFPFRPWHSEASIVGGAPICNYIRDTAAHYGIDKHIKLRHRVIRAAWSSAEALWTLKIRVGETDLIQRTCRFLYMCSGYYDYECGHSPEFPGANRFAGPLLHPQQWPTALDYAGKRIVVIGSGATAVTLVPALARDAQHVTLLQRSPTYIVPRATVDKLATWLYRGLPDRVAAKAIKWKNVLYGIVMFRLARSRPQMIKRLLIDGVRRQLDASYDTERHFTPRYNPWDQRVCLVPDGDLFAAIRSGHASIVTDTIDTFVEAGIRLQSGVTLPADIIVSATGLTMQLMGGADIVVDAVPVSFHERMLYKGVLFSGVPNLAIAFGYTNASWTLRCDLSARYVCRLLNYMDRKQWLVCVPELTDTSVQPQSLIDFSSGYVRRASGVLPRQGQKKPWRVHQNYLLDLTAFTFGSVRDGSLKFSATPRGR